MKKLIMVLASASVFSACQKQANDHLTPQSGHNEQLTESMVGEQGQNPDDKFVNGAGNRNNRKSFLYLESNEAALNTIVTYEQSSNGKLTWVGETNSGGKGLGAGLASQGAVALDDKNKFLFAVNAGSNSISSFRIAENGSLKLLSTESTHGERPISVAVHDRTVYAVNSLSADVFGFNVHGDGKLDPIGGSLKKLSSPDAMPAQVGFSPDGDALLVTEKGTSKITAFKVYGNGSIGNGVTNTSVGTTAFGFDFARGEYMIVTNADAGAIGTSSCTAYRNLDNLLIKAINGKVDNGQSAVCWVANTSNGRYAFTSNTGSNTITAYFIDGDGKIYFIPWVVVKSGGKPADIIVSSDNEYLYNINGEDKTLGQYRRTILGGLQNIGYVHSIPDFAAGLVSF